MARYPSSELLQYVLGIISDKNKMAIVKRTENTAIIDGPSTSAAYIPAMVAPAVLAMVFNIRIAAIG